MRNFLSQELDKEYPKPDKRGWEEQYRYAKALEQASEVIVKFFAGLDSQYTMLSKKEKDEAPSIEEA